MSNLHSLSTEQLAIVEFVVDGKGNLIVRARAGTGKTYLILRCLDVMNGSIAIVAYGKAIAAEIREKVAVAGHRNVDVATFHSIGQRVLMKMKPKAKLEGVGKGQAGYYKFDKIVEALEIPKYLQTFVRKTMSMAMLHGFGIGGVASAKDQAAWEHIVEHYNIGDEIADDNVAIQLRGRPALHLEGIRFAYRALNLSREMADEIYTYDEMLWLPLILNGNFPKFDWVCVDECQDVNPCRLAIARRMMHDKTRAMFVGDNFQAIFGFTGADSNSLDTIEKTFNCKIFPMTMTFRCGKAIVELAKTIVADYKASPSNHEGAVSTITEAEFEKLDLVPGEDAIICRNTRPLIKVAYNLLKRSIAAHIEGKDIGKGLVKLIERFPNIKNLQILSDKLGEYRDREVEKLTSLKREAEIDALVDKVESILFIIESMPKGSNANDVVAKINGMFADTAAGEKAKTVVLMTAHRSKGREFNRVFGWGRKAYMPSKRAKKVHELQQESNNEYVLLTRAINTYVDVTVSGA